jgi:hypothetical protein
MKRLKKIRPIPAAAMIKAINLFHAFCLAPRVKVMPNIQRARISRNPPVRRAAPEGRRFGAPLGPPVVVDRLDVICSSTISRTFPPGLNLKRVA